MNREKIDTISNRLEINLISELQNSLLIIKDSHHSNELIVNRLQQVTQSEQHVQLCNTLQKDMELINDQLNTILRNLNTVKSTE